MRELKKAMSLEDLEKEAIERKVVVDALNKRRESLLSVIEEEDRKLRGVLSTINRFKRANKTNIQS